MRWHPPVRGPGSSRGWTARRPTGTARLAPAVRRAIPRRRVSRDRRRRSSRASTALACWPPCWTSCSVPRRLLSASSWCRTVSSAATSRSPACSPGATSPARSSGSRPTTATCYPTWCCREGSSSTECTSKLCRATSRSARPTAPRSSPPCAVSAVPDPVVAVVGRPNVGKSTLVNRFVGKRAAIVEEHPGVTRDRKELQVEWAGRHFTVVDTGGWLAEGGGSLESKVSRQAEQAIEPADLILFVGDVPVGATSRAARVASILQRSDKPVVIAANKVDDERREPDIWEAVRLGLGEPHPVSALHGRTTGDLLDAVVGALPAEPEPPATEAGPSVFSVAIVGRPNVGKSTLFNRLVGEERSVVHDLSGPTRDAVDTIVETDDGTLRFVDTAGLR